MNCRRWYVGVRAGRPWQAFPYIGEPQPALGYAAVIGPFRTKRGALYMARHGANNPHCRDVADAERLAQVELKVIS